MFSFHKPKIYRSLKGCCICRAKSSSSRFTDSKRYETDFERCFKTREHRSGEICNACVLLVKRWKKLPAGSNRNWHHVVDARAGPGTKSINKIKNKCKEELLRKKKKLKRAMTHSKGPSSPAGLSDDIGDEGMSDHSIRSLSPINSDLSDYEMDSPQKGRRRKSHTAPRRYSSFLDLNYWKKTEICCGTIFKGANGELLLDRSLWRPCRSCKPAASPCARQASECSAASDSGVSTQDEQGMSPEGGQLSGAEAVPPEGLTPSPGQEAALPPADSPPPPVLTPATAQPFNNEAAACAVLDLSLPRTHTTLPGTTLPGIINKPIVALETSPCIQMEV